MYTGSSHRGNPKLGREECAQARPPVLAPGLVDPPEPECGCGCRKARPSVGETVGRARGWTLQKPWAPGACDGAIVRCKVFSEDPLNTANQGA